MVVRVASLSWSVVHPAVPAVMPAVVLAVPVVVLRSCGRAVRGSKKEWARPQPWPQTKLIHYWASQLVAAK